MPSVFSTAKSKKEKKQTHLGFVRKAVLNITDRESDPPSALFLLSLKTEPQALDSCILLKKEQNCFEVCTCMRIYALVYVCFDT